MSDQSEYAKHIKKLYEFGYAGEITLPGGRREEGDKDDIETFLREAKEEIGLDPSLIEVVAVLEPLEGRRNVVAPVLRVLHKKDAYRPVLNPDEVALIFDAPLDIFLEQDDNRRAEERETAEREKYHLHTSPTKQMRERGSLSGVSRPLC